MSLVGPRPEDRLFVHLQEDAYEEILSVRPGITGLCQLAFAEESRILDPADRMRDYTQRLLPQKTGLDRLYAGRRSVLMDLSILRWTILAVVARRPVAVDRQTARLTVRNRRDQPARPVGAPF
jgi:lipopolysaccharide/colanic/teichoic acid biosynthesis glycosyltransferase